MKFVIICAVLCITTALAAPGLNYFDKHKDGIKQYKEECIKITGVDKELVHMAHKGKFENDGDLKQYFFCLARRSGIMSENNNFHPEAIRENLGKKIEREMLDRIITECTRDKHGGGPEVAFNFFKCYTLKKKEEKRDEAFGFMGNKDGYPQQQQQQQQPLQPQEQHHRYRRDEHKEENKEGGHKEEKKSKIKQFEKVCESESGVSKDVLNKAKKGKFTQDDDLKDYYHCISRKTGMLNEKDEFKADAIKQNLGEKMDNEKQNKIVKECTKDKSGSGPEKAFKLFKCYTEKKKEMQNSCGSASGENKRKEEQHGHEKRDVHGEEKKKSGCNEKKGNEPQSVMDGNGHGNEQQGNGQHGNGQHGGNGHGGNNHRED